MPGSEAVKEKTPILARIHGQVVFPTRDRDPPQPHGGIFKRLPGLIGDATFDAAL